MRFWIFVVSSAALFIAGWFQGTVAFVFENDFTGLTWVVLAIVFAGLFFLWKDWRFPYDFVVNELPTIGLTGTVVGVFIVLSGGPSADELLYGLGTALGTTLVAALGRLWLLVLDRAK
jgi:hypothetical protein